MELSWAAVAIFVGLVIHAGSTIWWVSSFRTSVTLGLKSVVDSVVRLDKELEKRDTQIAAAWSKIDSVKNDVGEVKNRVSTLEVIYQMEHNKKNGLTKGE